MKHLRGLKFFYAAISCMLYSTLAWECASSLTVADAEANLQHIFRHEAPPSPHTFIFFVNGAQDHYVPESIEKIHNWGRADAYDVHKKIEVFAKECVNCNVVLLHIQLGGARPYTANGPWATYLTVYSNGREIKKRHENILNATDPQVVTKLIQHAHYYFPGTFMHFIYRGHSFYEPYDPRSTTTLVRPFDENFSSCPYGPQQFIKGLEQAGLRNKLSSLTFAACSMQKPDLMARLEPFTERVIASPTDINEMLSRGFSYEFLKETQKTDTPQRVADRIQQCIFRKG